MTNIELTDIERETFPALPQLYDLVDLSSTKCINIVRKQRNNPDLDIESVEFSGKDTDALIEALSKCEELFPTNGIHCIPDGIAVNIVNVEEPDEMLNIIVYYSKNNWVALHIMDAKGNNAKGFVAQRFYASEKFRGVQYLDLTDELKSMFVTAQEIVIQRIENMQE